MKRLLAAALALACLVAPAWADPYVLTATSWAKIASAGTTVEVQTITSTPVRIVQATGVPSLATPGQILGSSDAYRKYDAPLPQDLYAIAAGPAGASIVVQPIGAAGGGGSVSGTVTANQGTAGTAPWPVAQQSVTWTQTIVTLAAGTSATLIAANTARRALYVENTGTGPCTVAPGTATVTVGQGRNLSPAPQGTGYQGGSMDFTGEVSTQAFAAVSAAGTVVTVWEGQ